MTRHSWTTEGERKWLVDLIPDFLEAQENKTTSTFWPNIYQRYAEEFPIAPPTADEINSANGNLENATRQKKKAIEKVWHISSLIVNKRYILNILSQSVSFTGSIITPVPTVPCQGQNSTSSLSKSPESASQHGRHIRRYIGKN